MKIQHLIPIAFLAFLASGNALAQATPDAELDCDAFRAGVMSGKIPATTENRTRAAECNKPSATSATAAKELPTVEVQGKRQPKPDMGKAAGVATKGCGIGAIIGSIAGVDANVGCAVGGAIGFGWSYKKQMKDARELEQAAKAAGMNATVETDQVKGKLGKSEERLRTITIPYEAQDMETMDTKTAGLIDKMARLAEKSKAPLLFRFEGNKACQIPLAALKSRGVLANHTVDDQCGKSSTHKITIAPIEQAE